jgi:transcriptional regulator with XRE-family HTH domain
MFVSDDDSFGARLRHERERRQISLQSVADRTKIGIGLLKGLERDDVSRWPSGIFRRAFIRAYAEATGLDADEVTREFVARFPDPVADHPVTDDGAGLQKLLQPSNGAREPAARNAVLRLRLADDAQPFLVELGLNWHQRALAIAWDLAVVSVMVAILCAVGSAFWMSTALATIGYYAGAVMLLGNTPGACLSSRRRATFPSPSSEDEETLAYSIAPPPADILNASTALHHE